MSSALAIAYRKPTSGWLAPLFLLSVGLHIGAATLALWASHHRQGIPNEGDMSPAGTPGQTVVELIAPSSSDQTPLDTPPTDIPPTDTPPTDTPPTDAPPIDATDSDFIEPTTNPQETSKARPKAPPERKDAKRGLMHRAGVIDGNDTDGTTEGTPGLKTGTATGAHRPDPPYPMAARTARIQGKGAMRVTYGSTGSVTTVIITRPINPLLDANTRSFVSKHWKGLPNTTKTHPVNYVLE